MKLLKFIRHPLSMIAVTAGLIILIILIGTPYLIGEVMQRWIESQGSLKEKVENIDFNPFTGTLVLYNLQVETAGGRTLDIPYSSVKLSWAHLIKRQIYLSDWIIEDARLLVDRLEDNRLRVAGLILEELIGATDEAGTPEWAVGVGRFRILNSRVIYDTPELKATYHIDRYLLTRLESWDEENTVAFELKGKINTSPVHINAEVSPFAPAPSWKGHLKLQQGDLSLLSKAEGLQDLSIGGTINVDLDLKAVLQKDDIVDIAAEGSVNVQKLTVRDTGIALEEEHLAWEGTVTAKKLPSQGLDLLAEGKLTSGNLDVKISSTNSHIQLAGYSWNGNTQFKQQDDTSTLAMEAALEGGNTAISDTLRNLTLLQFKNIKIPKIDLQSLEDINISEITVQQPAVLSYLEDGTKDRKDIDRPVLQAASADIRGLSLKQSKDLSINSAALKDLKASLRREKQGHWHLLDSVAEKPDSSRNREGPGEKASGRQISFRLDRLQIAGESSIRFEDESTYKPYRTTLHIKEFQLEKINTSDTGIPARVKFIGNVGPYNSVTLEGDIRPFEERLSLDMNTKIEALDMPPLSAYTVQTTGYNLTSGQMDADVNLKIIKGKMDGNADLHMRNLEMAPLDPEKAKDLDDLMDVPLESALSMLRNKNDEIHLNIEIEGDTANPEFDYQDAINQAIARATQFAALNYLKYTLQPFGTYIAIADLAGAAGKELTKIRLDPVYFASGVSELDERASQYLVRVAEILTNRPKLRLEICGKAVEKDRTAMQERLQETQKDARGKEVDILSEEDMLNLAKDRAALVKSSLSNKHGVRHERMYLCLPEFEASPENHPIVELLLE